MRRGYQTLMERRKKVTGKRIVGIDPASQKHQAVVLNEEGMQMGRSFSFPVSYEGYEIKLWKALARIIGDYNPENVVFAVESSCTVWKGITDYLTGKGYTVLLVNPLTTYHSRPLMNHDFSKTDQKDALIIATNARNGAYADFREFSAEVTKLHRLSIAYEKVGKDRQKAVARLRSLMEEVFPEYLSCIGIDTQGSLYLLDKYFLPSHFQNLSIGEEEKDLRCISNGNHGADTLMKLQALSYRSVGCHIRGEEEILTMTLGIWIRQIRQNDKDLKTIGAAMIEMAKKMPYFEILVSLKGISDLTASRFIAEVRDLSTLTHYKQIEKYAGANVRLMDSGKYAGTRRISKIGNKRLLRLIYLMTTQTVKFIPELRAKFVTRQLKNTCYRKNIIAVAPWLLKLIVALIKENRPYVIKEEVMQKMKKLEATYTDMRNRQKKLRQAA